MGDIESHAGHPLTVSLWNPPPHVWCEVCGVWVEGEVVSVRDREKETTDG